MAESRAEERGADGELSASLPTDVLLRIISRLPSPLLFECRTLSKDLHRAASLTLARRPFFLYQNPASHCFLLPFDTPSTPLPVSFRLGEPPFKLAFARSNLVCLQRLHSYVLNICVCSIFCKWKFDLPTIAHPYYASHYHPCIENKDVNSLTVVEFEVLSVAGTEGHADGHVHGAYGHGSPGADGHHVAGNEGHVTSADDERHVSSADGQHGAADDGGVCANDGLFCRRCNQLHHFRVVVGKLHAHDNYGVFDKPYKKLMFDSRYPQWSEQDSTMHVLDYHRLMASTVPHAFTLYDERTCKLKVAVPRAKDANNKVLELEAILPTDRAVESTRYVNVWDLARYMQSGLGAQITDGHHHSAKRYHVCSFDLVYRDQVYVFMIDFERLVCMRRGRRPGSTHPNIMTIEEAMKYLWAEEDLGDRCDELFPASTTCRLMLYTIHVDVTTPALHIRKENASALLKLANMLTPPTFRERKNVGKFLILDGGGAPH